MGLAGASLFPRGFMNQNLERLKDELKSFGVRYLVYSPGARNARVLQVMAQEFELLAHPDERSAAFFALGLNAAAERLVAALLVTSGTAVSECYSAVIEAYYSRVPFLILTADRPRRYQGRGTPQTIDQVGIFSSYAHVFSFADTDDVVDWSKLQSLIELGDRPIQVNVFLEDSSRIGVIGNKKRESSVPSNMSRPLIVVGELSPSQRSMVRMTLEVWRQELGERLWWVCEPLSGLHMKGQGLWGGDFVIPVLMERGLIQSVIKIGGCPVGSWWRDLEEKYGDIPVWSFGDYPWPHLAREVAFQGSLSRLSEWGFGDQTPEGRGSVRFFRLVQGSANDPKGHRGAAYYEALDTTDQATSRSQALPSIGNELSKGLPSFADLLPLLRRFADSEWSWVRRWCEWAQGSYVYLGNSLPVRHFDLVSFGLGYQDVWAHRGANGIDGQLSGFLGRVKNSLDMAKGQRFQGLFGDLTAFYDLQSIWWMRSLHEQACQSGAQIGFFILNNRGGQIFRKLPDRKLMVLPHEIDFSAWAKIMEIPFERLGPACDDISNFVGIKIFEIQVNHLAQEQLEREWRGWLESFFKNEDR